MITARTKSPDDTRELAGAMAGLARAGDVVLLAGELGAGKTVFAQGFGRALGIEEPITSPSFTLVRIYPGRVRLVHADPSARVSAVMTQDPIAVYGDADLPSVAVQMADYNLAAARAQLLKALGRE